MSKHAGTIIGAVLLAGVVLVVLATQKPQDGHHDVVLSIAAASPAPSPSVTPTAAPTRSVLTSSLPLGSAKPHPAQPSEPLDTATGITAHSALIAWLVVLGVLPFFALLGIALHARHRSKLLELDHPPLRDRQSVQAAYAWKLAEAQASAGTLHSLSYAPKWSNRVEAAAAVPALPPARVLSLSEVLGNRDLVIGSAHEGPLVIEGEWTSVGVGGVSNSGKSSTIASLVAQHAARGSRIFLADPHAQAQRRSLTGYLAPLAGQVEETASRQLDILRMVERVHRELEIRKRHGHVDRPIVTVVDEWLSLILGRDGEELADLLIQLIVEGQKSDVTVILAAQNWMAAAAGGSLLRNPLPVTIAHRMRAGDMRALTGARGEVPPDILELPPGHAYASGPWGVTKVVVPHVRPEDLSLPGLPSGSLPGAFQAPGLEGNGELVEGNGKAPNPRDSQIRHLFLIGTSVPEICAMVFGVTSNDGRRYLDARVEVEAAIRRALAGEDN